MVEYPYDLGEEKKQPTLRELLAGYTLFNAWEAQEQATTLAQLSVEESLRQYFELCSLASSLCDDDDPIFLEQNAQHWAKLRKRLEQLQTVTSHGKTTPSSG